MREPSKPYGDSDHNENVKPEGRLLPVTESMAPLASFPVKLLIVIYILAYTTAALIGLIDAWVHDFRGLRALAHLDATATLPKAFQSAVYAMIGSVLGCATLDLVSFHQYVVKQDFRLPHTWGYFFAPWLAGLLGLFVFTLIQSGLLVFAGGGGGGAPTEAANMGTLSVGFLAGFGWYEVIRRIQRLVQKMFRESEDAQEKDKDRPPRTGEVRPPDGEFATGGAPTEARTKGSSPAAPVSDGGPVIALLPSDNRKT